MIHMEFTFKGSILKVGNSLTVSLPKAVVDVYSIKKGDKVSLNVTDTGIYIPLSAKKTLKTKEKRNERF